MAKWSFALLVFLSAGVQADGLSPQTGGCAVLNEIIYEEVTAARWGITGADLVFTNFNEPGVVVCAKTTEAVSAAFASAMTAVGRDVAWDDGFHPRAETCLSGFIEQCTPRSLAFAQPALASSATVTWQAISGVVVRAMPEGSATDRSIFSTESMRRAVRAALR